MKSRVSLRVETLGKLFNKYAEEDDLSNDIYDIGEIDFSKSNEASKEAELLVSNAAENIKSKKDKKPSLEELNAKIDAILNLLSKLSENINLPEEIKKDLINLDK